MYITQTEDWKDMHQYGRECVVVVYVFVGVTLE